MAIEIPACNDSQWDLLRKILLTLPSISTGGGGGGGGDVTQAGNNTFTGSNTFNGAFNVPCSIEGVNRRLLDSGCDISVDWENRRLYDAAGGMIIADWNSQILNNSAGTTTLNWASAKLFQAGVISVDWSNRLLVDSAGVTFLDWENGTINGLVYPTADGAAGSILTTDGAGNLTFQPPAPSSSIPTSYSLSRMTVGGGLHITFAHGVVPVGKTLTMEYVQSIVDDGTTPAANQIVVVRNVTTATNVISANGNFLGPVVVATAGQEWLARFENNAATNVAINASVHGHMD